MDENTARVQSGLEFILSHFKEEPLFPRKVSTIATKNSQKPVQDIVGAMTYFQGASWQDCRIAAFRVGQTNPDLIFIDLDALDFISMRSLKLGLTATLKNIKDRLSGYPTVLWSGRGYHVILPIDCPANLDNVEDLVAIVDNSNDKFLQFATKYLSHGKSDPLHNPALKSCLLRIPGSINSRCKAAGIDSKVKIVQKWDGYRPDYRLLIGSFHADLVGKRNEQVFREYKARSQFERNDGGSIPETYRYIDILLETSIEDFRKHAVDVIIIPYLVVMKGMQDRNQIYDIVMQWLDKCNKLRRLEPSRRYFINRVRRRIDGVMQDRVPPMKWDTLKRENPNLFETLKPSDA